MSAGVEMAGLVFDVLLETDILVSPVPIWEDEREHTFYGDRRQFPSLHPASWLSRISDRRGGNSSRNLLKSPNRARTSGRRPLSGLQHRPLT